MEIEPVIHRHFLDYDAPGFWVVNLLAIGLEEPRIDPLIDKDVDNLRLVARFLSLLAHIFKRFLQKENLVLKDSLHQ